MGQEAGSDAIYMFGPFRLDAQKHQLTRKGRRVDLDVKPTQVLIALVEEAGKLVRKEGLLKKVWGDTAVSDDSFYQHICVLRGKLGERPKDNKYIMTIPREGYKFVAPVKIVDRMGHAGPVEIVAPIETLAPVEQGQGNVIAPAEIVATTEQVPNKVIEGEENAKPGVYDKDGNLVIGAAEYEAIMEEASHYPESLNKTRLNGDHESRGDEPIDWKREEEMDEAAFAADQEEQKLRDRLEEIDAEDDGRNDHENLHYDPD